MVINSTHRQPLSIEHHDDDDDYNDEDEDNDGDDGDDHDNYDNDDDRRKRRLECIICCSYFIVSFVVSYVIPWQVHERPIPVQLLPSSGDYALHQVYNEPMKEETISITTLILIGGVLPFIVQMILSSSKLFTKRSEQIHKRHQTLCVYLVSIATNTTVTEALKLYCGSLRPIFYTICQPDDTYRTCTTTDTSELDDARKSFPSGHASQAWNGLFLLTLFMHHTWGIGNKKQGQFNAYASRGMSLVASLPMILATWIAASRIRDNQHFAVDVVGGSILGAAIAHYVHNMWFNQIDE